MNGRKKELGVHTHEYAGSWHVCVLTWHQAVRDDSDDEDAWLIIPRQYVKRSAPAHSLPLPITLSRSREPQCHATHVYSVT
eukprot:1278170-Rhodomonas_salina.1